ncbi:hypothetical protein F511_22713 [Dorcoceras hygrometricum]|uniref:Uncharacterized protein n=1 Tax=Dorcoceras hygrometricum TaxID=472368 RepID=A0A2Z7C1H5_9LAMI|nr:hypothetical protein F511_22713 [Dorcoceras hygrometricum]
MSPGGACLTAGAVSIPLEISLTIPLPPALAEIVLSVKIWHHTFTTHMANQIKRRNVSGDRREDEVGGSQVEADNSSREVHLEASLSRWDTGRMSWLEDIKACSGVPRSTRAWYDLLELWSFEICSGTLVHDVLSKVMPPIVTSEPEDRAARSPNRPTPSDRESRPRTPAKLGSVSREEDHASKSPTGIRLSFFELCDHRESRRASLSKYSCNLHQDESPASSKSLVSTA